MHTTRRSLVSWLGLLGALSGCGAEHDVDVFVVLPVIDRACGWSGAARVDLHVTGPGPEEFVVSSDRCTRHAEAAVEGFFTDDAGQLRLEKLAPTFYWLTARIYDAEGTLLGERTQPFDARETPLVVVFERADLPAWPTTTRRVQVPACADVSGVASLRIEILPDGAYVPAVDEVVPCDAEPSTLTFDVPIGPVTLTGEGMRSDGTVCLSATRSVVVDPAEDVLLELALEGACD